MVDNQQNSDVNDDVEVDEETENTPQEETAAETETKRFHSEIETVGPCKIEVKITIPVETIRAEVDDRYREIMQTVAFPGFRIGHAPRRLVEKKLGDDVASDAKQSLINDSFKDAVKTHDLDPIHEPDVDLSDLTLSTDQPLQYAAVLLVRPTVEIPDYESITVQAPKAEVTDEMVSEALLTFRRRHAVLESVPNEKMEEGDVAILDLEATVEDEKLLERENAEYHHPAERIVGLPASALKDEILGKARDDEFSITQKLPEAWPDQEKAGKEMVIEITVRDVKRYNMPELTDEIAEELDYDSVEEIEEEIREQLERYAENAARTETDRRIVEALIQAAPFDLPEDVVKEETGQRIERKRALLRMRGAGEEEIEEKLGEAMTAEKAEVEGEFRAGFLLDAIAKKQKIFVTEDEVEDRIAQMAGAYNRSVEEMKEYLEQRNMTGSIRSNMREEKVVDLLREKVKIEEAP